MGDAVHIKTDHVLIRYFDRDDCENLFRIVREEDIRRFMADWSEGRTSPQDYCDWIDTFRTDSADFNLRRAYAVALPGTNEMIGMAAIGVKDALREVEIAYFMSEAHRHRGYTREAVNALVDWSFRASDLKYVILTANCANIPSNRFAVKCGFELLEKRTPMEHGQPIEGKSYFYYRKYRS